MSRRTPVAVTLNLVAAVALMQAFQLPTPQVRTAKPASTAAVTAAEKMQIEGKVRAIYGPEGAPQVQISMAPGDIATGVVIDEKEGEEIYLDKDPCNANVLKFTKPYRKTRVGTKDCDGKKHDTYEVRQLKQ